MNDLERVLHFIPGFSYGGIESRFFDWYERLDKTRIQFDLLIQTDSENPIFNDFKEKGGRVYQVDPISAKTIKSHIKNLKQIFAENDYTAVHCHSPDKSLFVLTEAQERGIKNRILHARTSSLAGSKNFLIKSIMMKLSIRKATNYFATSKEAAIWLFGNKNIDKVSFIKNAVDSEKFSFKEYKRQKTREGLNLSNNYVIGHVGRFTYAKNHTFIIELFRSIYMENKTVKLLLVGNGPTEIEIKRKVNKYGLEKNVIFVGYSEEPELYYPAMDAFLFPSHYEGLPGTLIEAQLSGLPCVISNNITEEAIISNDVKKLSLTDSMDSWKRALLINKGYIKREDSHNLGKEKGFDLNTVVKELEKKYLES